MRSTITRTTAAILLFSILTLTAPIPAEASNVGRALTVGIQSSKTNFIRPLDPLERDILSVYNLVYEPLVRIDDKYKPSPCLAENWSPSEDGRSWTFTIRSNVTFSDGSPMTARDVAATANAILERANDESSSSKGFYSNLHYFVSKVSATGDHTLVVRTTSSRSYYGLLYAMTFPVLPADEIDKDDPMGTGPYIITDFTPGGYISMEVNPNWWKTRPSVEQITFVCHDTQRAVMESYEFGRVNTIFTRSIAAAQYKSGSASLAMDYRSNQLECLLMNQSYAKLASENVRKAIRYVVDPDYIATSVYLGMVTRTDTPMIPGTWTYNDGIAGYFVRDLEKARQLILEDGWVDSDDDGVVDRVSEEGQKIDLTLRMIVYEEPDNDVRFQAATIIQEELAQIGIEVSITTCTYTEAQQKLRDGNFHLALVAFAQDVCPDPGYMLISGNTYNYGRYKSQEMSDLCKKLRTCVAESDYEQTLRDIQELFAKDCPMICLYFRDGAVLTRFMYTTVRDVREYELLRGIESFRP
ncbi:MAG: ABC transporter substrate-binding protein [Clostridia bacterium]|nr:ABC transporter substrate-binding protein [Clostridia bacterium]